MAGWAFSPREKRLLWAVAAALAIGAAATSAGALLHHADRRSCVEGNNDCVEYQEHGWPWQWRSTAPQSVIDRNLENSDCGMFCIDRSGWSLGVFLFTSVTWALIFLPIGGALVLIRVTVMWLLTPWRLGVK